MLYFSRELTVEYSLPKRIIRGSMKKQNVEITADNLVISDQEDSKEVSFPLEELNAFEKLLSKDIILQLDFQDTGIVTINFRKNPVILSLFLEKIIRNWIKIKFPLLYKYKKNHSTYWRSIKNQVSQLIQNIEISNYKVAREFKNSSLNDLTLFIAFLETGEYEKLIVASGRMIESLHKSYQTDVSTTSPSMSNADDFLLGQYLIAQKDSELYSQFEDEARMLRKDLFSDSGMASR